MSRYFFHVVGGESEFRDECGRHFSTPQGAAAHAEKIASELAKDGDHYRGFAITVSDEDDNELVRVTVEAKG